MANARGRKGKIGKKKGWIAAYYGNQQNLLNKLRRIVRRLKKHPADVSALACEARLVKALPSWKIKDFY